MSSFAHVVQTRVGFMNPRQMQSSSTCTHLHSPKSGMSSIVMRDRSKNRKPLQKGRYLSIEAIQTIQALKRAANHSESETSLRQVYVNKFGRLLKFDMIAVLRELLRQNQCHLALKVNLHVLCEKSSYICAFEDIRKEDWYKPKLFIYAEMVTALGSNGMLEKVELLIMELKVETTLDPDIEGFNSLLESLMSLNLTGLAMECFT